MARVVLPIRGMPPTVPVGPVRQLGGRPVAAFKSGGSVGGYCEGPMTKTVNHAGASIKKGKKK